MKTLRTLIATAAALLAASSAEAAGVLATPPASVGFGVGYDIHCEVVNAHRAAPVRLQVEVRDYAGNVLDSALPFELLAGQSTGFDPSVGSPAYCVFRVLSGSAKNLRAAANYVDADDNIVIVPAR